MRFKGTGILFVVFVVLGGYIYFTEFRGREERQKQEEAKKRLFAGEAADVSELTLEFEGRTLTAVRKGEKIWAIASPAGLEADSEAWEELASGFVRIEKDETVSTTKTDLAPYGLDMPVVKVTAKLKSGTTSGVLFGAENPRKSFHYAKRLDSDEVFLSPTTWGSSFKKSLTDLRYKKALDFETENIDSFRVTVAGKPEIEFQKSGANWLIKKPIETRADTGEASGFLSSIEFSRTSAFAEETLDVKSSGIDAPAVRLTLHDQKANADKVLLFGKSPEKDKYYAKDQSRAPIFILGTEILQKAQQSLLDWRDKSVAHLGPEGSIGIDELEIARGLEKIGLKRVGLDWQLLDGKKTKENKVSEMLGALENARAVQIIDAPGSPSSYGLDKPRLAVTLRKAGKNVEVLSFGRDSLNPAGVYVKGTGAMVMTAGKELYDAFDVQLTGLLDAQPAPAVPPK